VLARTLEKSGFSTILVTNMPFWAEKIGVPRTLAVEFPFGHTLGQPKNVEQQMRVVRQAIQGLEEIEKPGAILHSPEVWPIPKDVAIREWQPEEPSPVVQLISKSFREMMRQSRKK
jgi:hypothetical protein